MMSRTARRARAPRAWQKRTASAHISIPNTMHDIDAPAWPCRSCAAPDTQGAIYVTDNTAYTWTAAVQETVDATLNRTVSSGAWRGGLGGAGTGEWGVARKG